MRCKTRYTQKCNAFYPVVAQLHPQLTFAGPSHGVLATPHGCPAQHMWPRGTAAERDYAAMKRWPPHSSKCPEQVVSLGVVRFHADPGEVVGWERLCVVHNKCTGCCLVCCSVIAACQQLTSAQGMQAWTCRPSGCLWAAAHLLGRCLHAWG